MKILLIFSVLLATSSAGTSSFSFSPMVGHGYGGQFILSGMGRITAVRTWEYYNGHVRGLQLRFGYTWSSVAGYTGHTFNEFELFDGEYIVQVSGKHSYYIQALRFVTNRGRSINAGQPFGQSFNMYTHDPSAELQIVSGRQNNGLRAIAAHWAFVENPNNSTNSSD